MLGAEHDHHGRDLDAGERLADDRSAIVPAGVREHNRPVARRGNALSRGREVMLDGSRHRDLVATDIHSTQCRPGSEFRSRYRQRTTGALGAKRALAAA